jgi:transcriptional regulator with XRE-family HTH domain
MARSTHHPNYQTLLALLRDLRERAAVTQLALAESLGNTQTFISKVERGERRIDVVEFIEICETLGVDPAAALREYLQRRSLLGKRGSKLMRRTPS